MRTIPRIDVQNLGGLADKFAGLGKEVFGELFDEQKWIDAGEAQQAKGTEKLNAVRKQTKAKTHQRGADKAEDRQRAAAKAS